MLGAMQDFDLRVSALLDHAAREHGSQEIISHAADGTSIRSNWRETAHNARKCAQALLAIGIIKGDRVATLAMNHGRHLTSWYGVTGMGGVLHTVNPRLFDEQLVYICNHAADRVLLFDGQFAPIVERIRPHLTSVEHFIQFDPAPGVYPCFDDFIAPESGDFAWVTGDERDPCGLCYTSGTTGNPKGVLYEHRSNVLHAMTQIAPDLFDFNARSVVLPIVPMFHANSWGIPYAAALVGAKLVFSATNDAKTLWQLTRDEGVTHSAGVPTVWLSMFADMDANGGDYGKLRHIAIGGSAAPRSMIERLMRAGIRVCHAWGMTETSPLGTLGSPPSRWDSLDFDEQVDFISKQGRPPFGVEMRVIGEDGDELPRDGASSGNLQIRGPWVIKRYFGADSDAITVDGWFDTGDIGVLHPDGTMQITDRAKDVIKSGGEWISSIELENAAVGCPGVAEAAAVGIYHPKWDERPLLLVVAKPDAHIASADVLDYLSDKIAKWWLPDEVKFVTELPHTATGKLLKTAIRAEYKDYRFAE